MGDFVRRHGAACGFAPAGSWVALSPLEQRIRRKVEAAGAPLREWDINIYRGVLTGCNEAFIVGGAARAAILARCRSARERARTDALIRPILRGRDIRRYGYQWADLWLIATFPSQHYDIEDYPAVKQHLLSFGIERLEQTGKTHIVNGVRVKSRRKSNNKWFETQDSISYSDEFAKPKVVWNRIAAIKQFAYVEKEMFIQDSMHFIVGNHLEYLCAVLNSKIAQWLLSKIIGETAGGNAGNADNIWNLPIPRVPSNRDADLLKNRVRLLVENPDAKFDNEINRTICTWYNLDTDEQEYILNY